VEAEGVRRALVIAAAADIRIGMIDVTRPETAAAIADQLRPGDLLWLNKTDIASATAVDVATTTAAATFHVERRPETIAGSAATGAGVDVLERALIGHVAALTESDEAPPLTRARHRLCVQRAVAALARARERLSSAPELAAEDLRIAARTLGEITGRVDVEEILDRVFAGFCIGK
jgi:tRNA modification GTPase